jgi:hypothetical protein
MDRSYTVMQTSYNRLLATQDQLKSVKARYEEEKGDVPLDLYLESQRRQVDGETEYFLNRARYVLAAKNVHFVKGTLLDYDGIYLAEGPWCNEAYHDAAVRDSLRGQPHPLNYASSKAPVVSNGPFDQHPADGTPIGPSGSMISDPFTDDEVPLTPPANSSPANEPTLEPGEEPLPPPRVNSTSIQGRAMPLGLVQPNGIHSSNVRAQPPAGVFITDAPSAAKTGVAPALHSNTSPTASAASKEHSVSPTTRKLPLSITP